MKTTIAVVIIGATWLMASNRAPAQSVQQGHLEMVQYSVPPVPVMTMCEVNGVDYQVDFGYRICGVNGYGTWFVIGRIQATPAGPVAIRNDGRRFPAACE